MNNKIRDSINEDIKKCKAALNSQNSKSLYEVLYAKYRTLDDSIYDNSIMFKHKLLHTEIQNCNRKVESFKKIDDI